MIVVTGQSLMPRLQQVTVTADQDSVRVRAAKVTAVPIKR
jgi:hypothetical protein